MNLPAIQTYLAAHSLAGWLVYDFRGSNAVFAQLLPGQRNNTRRAFLFIPATGEPRLIISPLDAAEFAAADVEKDIYLTRDDLTAKLAAIANGSRLAMEYVPGGELPVMSIVDGGTLELIRSLGGEVFSSADLVQTSVAVWTPDAVVEHRRANELLTRTKDAAFALIARRLRDGQPIDEYQVQRFIVDEIERAGFETVGSIMAGVNAHAGDPHFEVDAAHPSPIRKGDWVLLDLWCKAKGEEHVFADITWTGYVGREVPTKMRDVFDAVLASRDSCLALAQESWRDHEINATAEAADPRAASHLIATSPTPRDDRRLPPPRLERAAIQGHQLDIVTRSLLISRGYEENLRHRTGHSLSPGPRVHGMGMNLDTIETRDTRSMLPGTGFTIEPGLYFPTFGVRSEINVYVDLFDGPTVTSSIQTEIVSVE